ncbi:MAG: CHASE2 domain-containing protein [Candidatus Aureabacteria bacterium]|nr:CHASE2 domain-containing protein [Candidatus Auribacterota bacterium]
MHVNKSIIPFYLIKEKAIQLFFAIIFVLVFITLEDFFPYLHVLNLKFRDISHLVFYYSGNKPDIGKNEIVLLLFDEKTENEMSCKFPFPRRFLKLSVQKILSDHPKLFAFDLVLTGESENKEEDAELAKLLGANKNIVLFTYVQTNNKIYSISPCFKALHNDIGLINKLRGFDHIARSILPVFFDMSEMRQYFCAEALLAMKYFNVPSDAIEQDPVNNRIIFNGKHIPLNSAYYGTEKELFYKTYYTFSDFKKVSFSDLIFNRISPGFFKDKIVLLGSQSLILHDVHNTPFGMQPGIAIVANSFLTFINNAFPDHMPLSIQYFFYFIIVFLFLTLYPRHPPPYKNLIFSSCYLFLIWMGDYFFFKKNILFDGAVPFYTILIYSIFNEIIFYMRLVHENRKIRDMVLLDKNTGLNQFYYFTARLKYVLYLSSKKNMSSWLCVIYTAPVSDNKTVSSDANIQAAGKKLNNNLSPGECISWNPENKMFYLLLKGSYFSHLKKRLHSRMLEPLMLHWISTLGHRPPTFIGAVPLFSLPYKTISNSLIAAEATVLMAFQKNKNILEFEPSFLQSYDEDVSENNNPLPPFSDTDFITEDIVHSKQSLEKLQAMLKMTAKEMEISERLASVGKIAAEVAHELKNPLQVLSNLSSFFSATITQDHPAYKYVEMYSHEICRMVKLCREMLDFSKPHHEFNKQHCDLNSLMETTLHFLEGTFKKKLITVEMNLDQNIGKISIDPDRIKQVFLNMLLNAADAMPKGGTLTVKTKLKGCTVQINIEDTGTGIPKENLDKIFHLFFTTKGDKGTGVGLSTCFDIINKHAGRILVESEVGKGTAFSIILPV